MDTSPRHIVAAAFATPHGAARAAAAVIAAHPDVVVNTAVTVVMRTGAPGSSGSRGWVPGRGALVSGVLGLIGGPLASAADSPSEAFATALRESGVPDAELARLGASLREGDSVLVLEIEQSAVTPTTSALHAHAPIATVTVPIGAVAAEMFTRVDDSICTPSAA